MSAHLHHQIIAVTDRDAAARWFVDLLELTEPWENGFFLSVQLDDLVVLNFATPPVEIQPQHYAFGVDDRHFDRIRVRFDADGTAYTGAPRGGEPSTIGAVNLDGTGRRLYFSGPSGHMLEVLTMRYTGIPAESQPGRRRSRHQVDRPR